MKTTPLLYGFSTFLCGLVVMAVELSAFRLLAPFFGNSLYVWTNLITLVLVALSLGYALGGKIADRRPDPKIYFSLIAMAGVWILSIPFLAPSVFDTVLYFSPNLSWTTRFGSLIAIFVLFSFPLFILGIIVPFTLKLSLDQLKGLGAVSGRLSMISTVGSLLGSFLPAFVLLPLLGTAKTFVLLGLVLVFLASYGLRQFWLFVTGLLALFLLYWVQPVYAHDRMLDFVDSPYGFVFVTEDELGVRRLHIDTPLGTQSIYDPDSALTDNRYYYSYFGTLPALVDEAQSVLILGHAGGSFTRIFNTYYPHLELTGVELDPAVTQMAEQYLGLDIEMVDIVHSDARAFLRSSEETYDLILVDTYHGANIPAHLATQEFFTLCTDHLTEGGLLALNAATTEGPFLDVLSNTLAQSFGTVFMAPIPSSFNFLLLTQADGTYQLKQPLFPALQEKWYTLMEANPQVRVFDPSTSVFKDDTLSEVEVLNEAMFMQLLEAF